jgi:hypothetical protein
MAKRSKRQIREELAKSIKEGDIDRMDKLLSTLHDNRESEAAIESLIKLAIDEYTNYVDMLRKTTQRPMETPFTWMHVLHEMLLRALLTDPDEYLKRSQKFQLRHYTASMREANSRLLGSIPSFSDSDYLKARDLFTTYYENYKKMCEWFSKLAGIISEDESEKEREWKSPFPDAQSRYACLRLDSNDTLIRNAISHKGIRRLTDGKFELIDRKGKVEKVLSAKTLDKRLYLLIMRIHSADIALSLSGITSNSIILVGIRSIKRFQIK